jgi:hypothetical protein
MDDLADEAERLAAEAERLLRPRHRDHDDRHHITDPYADMPRWVLTMKRTRIAELFRGAPGLPGHVIQVQQEIGRLISARNQRELEGMDGGDVTVLIEGLGEVRDALIAAAAHAGFDFDKFGITFSPLQSDLYLERRGGRLYVDGKAR